MHFRCIFMIIIILDGTGKLHNECVITRKKWNQICL